MPTNFPGSDDVFDEPASPSTTPLGDAGDEHTEWHENVGDALMAMQAQATLLVHSHDGVTARHGSKLAQANTHENPDTDAALASIHHTLDATLANPLKGAPGDHSHGAVNPYPIGAIFISDQSTDPSTYFVGTTWVAITGRFLVAAGGTFTAGSTGGSASTHTHTNSTTGSAGTHSHTAGPTGSSGSHTHAYSNNTGTSTFSHNHGGTSNSGGATHAGENDPPFVTAGSTTSHTHPVGASDNTSHSHSMATSGSSGGHTHTVPTSSTESDHTHTWDATGSGAHLPAYLVVYMWRRSA